MASSIDLTCQSQKPAISSLVSVNGPSITVRDGSREPDPLAFRAGLESFAGEHHAGLDQFFVELSHLR